MSIKMVLFDLDGTLLPMDQEHFVKVYFKSLAKKLAPYGYEPQKLIQTIWQGTEAMVNNDGAKLNREVFWDVFYKTYGEQAKDDCRVFDDFYENDFDREVRASCGYDPDAGRALEEIKGMGYRVALATNPIFPTEATQTRMKWAGLDKDMFELYTTYDNSTHCKPNLDYYRDILKELDLNADECLMVGNDVGEDMVAQQIGMKVFLLPKYLINRSEKDISVYPHGTLSDLVEYVRHIND